MLASAGQQPVIAAAKKAGDARQQPDGLPVEPHLLERRPQQRADEQHLLAVLRPSQAKKPPELSDGNPMVGIALDDLGVGPTFEPNITGCRPRRTIASATAPGKLPPPQMMAIGPRSASAMEALIRRRHSSGPSFQRRVRGRINGRLPPARMNAIILPTSGSSPNSRSTASMRSAMRPSTKNSAR